MYLFVSVDARFGAVCMLLLDNGACQLVTFLALFGKTSIPCKG